MSASEEDQDVSIDMDTNTSTAQRRKSGRVRSKPAQLGGANNGVKRKRASGAGSAADDKVDSEDEGDDEEEEDESEDGLDEDEVKRRRKQQRKGTVAKKQAAPKKPRSSGASTLAIRSAVNGRGGTATAVPRKSRGNIAAQVGDDETRLYREIFSEEKVVEEVAADWTKRWDEHNAGAMTEMINFVLRCAGCTLRLTIENIEDPDNAVSILTDLQDEYEAQKPGEYPLISKAKSAASFRSTMTGFFETLIRTCHAAGLLYSDIAIIENIEVWVSTLSSSSMRPFRHTAAVCAMAIESELCRVAAEIAEDSARATRQKEGEQKKKSVNKERVKTFTNKIAELGRHRKTVEDAIKSFFDTVFVHRYRDVDPRIRADCVTALGNWILILPDVFFEGMYLRYLGWVLSDSSAPTRAEVIKQLTRFYKVKGNVSRLRTFTERFRARIVEMATRDSEPSIRASAIELLSHIRDTGYLEPDDIDNVGRLIFDYEPRVRKAVAGFFAQNIEDLYENTVEEIGGEEVLAESIGEDVVDDYDSLCRSWIKLKCVAEALQSYDVERDEDDSVQQNLHAGLYTKRPDTRYALAAQTVCDSMPETQMWESVAGYLLYDLSAAKTSVERRCQLVSSEDLILLEVLNASVRSKLSEVSEGDADKKGRKSRVRKDELRAVQEATALHLAEVIPQLLKKYGSAPGTASAVLRLTHVLDLDLFHEMRQDKKTYAALLDDISKQFLSHTDLRVLAEAGTALSHARGSEDLEEVTDGKIDTLWNTIVGTLRNSLSGDDWSEDLTDISASLNRIAILAGIMDCTAALNAVEKPQKKSRKSVTKSLNGHDLLLEIIREPSLDSQAGDEADSTLMSAMKALLLHYMWSARSLQASKGTMDVLPDYRPFSSALTTLIENRHRTSPLRLAAVGTLLDLHTVFAIFRHRDAPLPSLTQHIEDPSESLILQSFTALESLYAKKASKKLERPPRRDVREEPDHDDDVDRLPDDDEDEEDGYDEEDLEQQDLGVGKISKQDTLLTERRLCEIAGKMVLAIVARVLDSAGDDRGQIGIRISRNKTRLGPNFKEIIAYLDGPKTARTASASQKAQQAPPVSTTARATNSEKQRPAAASAANLAKHKSSALVVSDDEDDDSDEVSDVEQNRELEDDGIEEADEEDQNRSANKDAGDDEIMGD